MGSFFGQIDKKIYNREIFLLVHHGGFDYNSVRKMPINLRRFFLDETAKALKQRAGKSEEDEAPLSKNQKIIMQSKLNQAGNNFKRGPNKNIPSKIMKFE